MFFIVYFLIENLNIFLIKQLFAWIYFGLRWVVEDIFLLQVGGGGWCWIDFAWWWVVLGGAGYILAGGGWWWVVMGGDAIHRNDVYMVDAILASRHFPIKGHIIHRDASFIIIEQICKTALSRETKK